MTDENESGIDDQREYAYWKAWVACKFISNTINAMTFHQFAYLIDEIDEEVRRMSNDRNK